MGDLALYLLPKLLAVFLLGVSIFTFYSFTRNKKRVELWLYFMIGMSGYNFMTYFCWGWLQTVTLSLSFFCIGGMFASQAVQHFEVVRASKRIGERIHRLDKAEMQWRRGEITEEEFTNLIYELRHERLLIMNATR